MHLVLRTMLTQAYSEKQSRRYRYRGNVDSHVVEMSTLYSANRSTLQSNDVHAQPMLRRFVVPAIAGTSSHMDVPSLQQDCVIPITEYRPVSLVVSIAPMPWLNPPDTLTRSYCPPHTPPSNSRSSQTANGPCTPHQTPRTTTESRHQAPTMTTTA